MQVAYRVVSFVQHWSMLCTGDKVVGTVFTTDQRGAYVDIGAKGQAFVPMEELSLSKVDRVRAQLLRTCTCCVSLIFGVPVSFTGLKTT